MKQKLLILGFALAFANIQSAKAQCPLPLIQRVDSVTDVVARVENYYPNGIINVHKEQDAVCAIKFAKQNNIKIAIKTGGHSQGGQWALNDGLILNLAPYKRLEVNAGVKTITARAGNTWEEIQKEIDPHGLAVQVMQSSNIFPVGGTIGMNAHGRDIKYGQIINTINWIKVVLPSGKIVIADPIDRNPNVFKAVVGGLGLSGVVLEANLNLRENKIYETIVLNAVDANDISQIFTLMRTNPKQLVQYVTQEDLEIIKTDFNTITPDKIGMGYGRAANLSKNNNDYLGKALFYIFVELDNNKITSEAKTQLSDKESFLQLNIMPLLMELQRNFESQKSFREKLEKAFMRKSGAQTSLNNLMDPPIEFLLYKSRELKETLSNRVLTFFRDSLRWLSGTPIESTDILKEYFIPNNRQAVSSFLETLRTTVKENDLNLMNITYRVVPKTPDHKAPYLNYAKEEMVAFVLDFHVKIEPTRWAKVKKWTQKLIEGALNVGGVHYLAYEAHASYAQFTRAYPDSSIIFSRMLREDDMNVFMNYYMEIYYNQYRTMAE